MHHSLYTLKHELLIYLYTSYMSYDNKMNAHSFSNFQFIIEVHFQYS
jgi:hypothetical protein